MGRIKELEFLNRALDDFVNVVSHDFKTLVSSISLLTELALKKIPLKRLRDFCIKLKATVIKLKAQLKGLTKLVDIKKSRSEKVDIVNLKHALDIILNEYNHSLEEIGGKLIADFSHAPEIRYFAAHINSLFSNLITKALKYSRPDTPLIIEVFSKRKKDYIVLTVKDNGIGRANASQSIV